MIDVACIGILVADAVTRTVERLPEKGKLSLVEHIDLFTGGCAASAAIDMARIGCSSAVSGKVGKDGFGAFMLGALEMAGVSTEFVVEDPEAETSASIVLVDEKGERSFLHSLGANAVFSENDVPDSLLQQSRIAFVAGTMLMPGLDGLPCARVLQRAKGHGCITALDTAWDSKGRWMKLLQPCMPHIDYFLPSYDEAVELTGERDPMAISEAFLRMGVRTAVIKLGEEGCLVRSETECHRVPRFPVRVVQDTTGAGDAFCAGFLTGVSLRLPLFECGRMGNAVGALCVSAVGASTGIRSMEQVQEIMRLGNGV